MKSYLLAHPEVIRDAIVALGDKEKKSVDTAQVLRARAKELFRNPMDGVAGNPKGDVTLVEFMDFNCGVCKKMAPEISAAIAADSRLRVVLKEWPVIGGDNSLYAAKAVLAAQKQGKYWAMHNALYAHVGTVTPDVVDRLARDNGIDLARMKTDMNDPAIEKNLAATNRLATDLQLSGTPGFVIGDQIIPGAVSASGLLEVISAVRSSGGCKQC